ncbi:CubicO group peptidase (beta-lactamase class C family) [Streptosporangium lutulentum]|uniref:CubicO group peptidase (Beta-lactamase class C family) n=2 Tax=Streptosporangium lutulentum TaxID=1461250 RepID=A0ABT9QE62_9ACTN|nr:serine hydrolase domain-containing protein [Streptosporangium lutulentum]MDP9844239.1 CubicO group peptidase (beta-lactamase class C family) [Streptosporangium lutulentum]
MRATRLGSISLVIAMSPCSQTPPTPETEPPRIGYASAVQAGADDLVTAGSPGATVHFREGDEVREAAAGFADATARDPMRPDHRFRIASITKTFTATLVLQLVHERKLALGDTLGRLLPGILPGADAVTVTQLLTHTSGIPDYLTTPRFMEAILERGEHSRRWPPRTLLSYVGKLSESGDYRYSNTNFILLGLIIGAIVNTCGSRSFKRLRMGRGRRVVRRACRR